MSLLLGAYIQQEHVYALFCTECGCREIYREVWIDGPDKASAQVSGFNAADRVRCVMCGAIGKTTNSETLAEMIREHWNSKQVRY